MKKDSELERMLREQQQHLAKLKEIVVETINEEKLIINNLMNPQADILTRGQRISDKVARFGGSWKFIIAFGVILFLWIVYNVVVKKDLAFDPYPFILMNLVLSCLAAVQAPIIMMSQNRQEEKDRIRAENDYLINLKAEMEIRRLHQKVDLLLEEQIKTLFETQARQLNLLNEIHKKMEKHQSPGSAHQ